MQNGASVLVPLCGKTSDMLWLLEQGHKTIGAELSPIAAQDFFAENKMDCETTKSDSFENYEGGNISILVGDFFDLTPADIPNIKAVYDRAALIALPAEMRKKYAAHLKTILDRGDQVLLITLAYDQAKMDGPPFSVTNDEVQNLFGDWCAITKLETLPPENFRGIDAFETTYKLTVT